MFFIALLSIKPINAQISLTDNATASQLIQRILGSGVTYSNPVLNCPGVANALFTTTSSNLGLTGGIVLTTGRALTVPSGPVGINGSSLLFPNNVNNVNLVDPDIQSFNSSYIQKDLCKLEFDFIPKGDTLSLNYVFASEEYTSYNCSKFGDVMGIFLSGPGYPTPTNIAKVPNTNVAVSINSINNGTGLTPTCTNLHPNSPFTAYYTSNSSSTVTYNGFTKFMTALASVTPFANYHVKIAIADISDSLTDSGLFIGEGSFTSDPILVLEKSSTGGLKTNPLYAIEGCSPGVVKFKRKKNNVPLIINLNYSGNALIGTDYTAPATSFTIPAGDTVYYFNVTALTDNLIEPNDSAKVNFSVVGNSFKDSVVFYIRDFATGMKVFNQSKDTTICFGKSIPLYASNLPLNYTAFWTPSNDVDSPSKLNAILTPTTANGFVNYNIALRIGHPGCPYVDSNIIVHIQPSPVTYLGPSPQVICKGDTLQLAALITPSGSYTYSWASNPTLTATNILNPKAITLSNQTYYFTASTLGGCSRTDSLKVQVSNIKNEITSIKVDSTSCGLINGKIKFNMNGANPPYLFSINGNPFVSTDSFTSLSSGSYNVKVKNGANCLFDTTLIVGSGAAAPQLSIVPIPTSCGLNNGKITATIIGGIPPYTFSWSNGATSKDSIINLASGNYSLTIKDSKNCTEAKSTIILTSSGVSGMLNKKDATCSLSNGSINAVITKGNSPYKFLWSRGDTTQNIANLTAGSYKVTITDKNGCNKTDSIVILNTPSISYSKLILNSKCFKPNGSITLNNIVGTAPYTYSWSNGQKTQNITNLLPGTYYLTMTDVKSCIKKDTITISSSPTMNYTLKIIPSKCNNANGAIQVTSLSGVSPFKYQWSNGDTTANNSNLTAGNYSISITDGNGCVVQKTAVLPNNSNPKLTINKTNATCAGSNGAITANVTGALGKINYLWSNGSTQNPLKNVVSGKYSLTITDSIGCSKIDSVNITTNPAAKVNYSMVLPFCNSNNGSLTASIVSGTPPFSFVWNNLDTNRSRTGLANGTYIVFYKDSLNCSRTDTLKLNAIAPQKIKPTIYNAICNSTVGSITTNVTNGKKPYKYLWSNGDTTSNLMNVLHGQYSLTVTDSIGCVVSGSYNIQHFPSPTYTDSIVGSYCLYENGKVFFKNIKGSTPFSYVWNDLYKSNFDNRQSMKGGTYTVEITDKNGCIVKDTFVISEAGKPKINFVPIKNNCPLSDGKISSNVTGGSPPYNYTWSTGGIHDTLMNLNSGFYALTVSDKYNCTVSEFVELENLTDMKLSFLSMVTRCDTFTGKVSVNPSLGTSPYKYKWNTGDTTKTIDSVDAGGYNVTVTDANGCTIKGDTIVEYIYTPKIKLDSFQETTCNLSNGSLYYSVTDAINPLKLRWQKIIDSTYSKVNILRGNYEFSVEDSNKCKKTISHFLKNKPIVSVDTRIIKHENCGKKNGYITLYVDNSFNPKFLWSTGDTTSSIQNLSAGTYSVSISDNNNCQITVNYVVEVDSVPTILLEKKDPICEEPNGSILATISAPYGYDSIIWNNNSNIGALEYDSLGNGKYFVRVIDPYGCVVKDSINLASIPNPKFNANIVNSLCTNGKGSIHFNPKFGNPPFTYLWNDFATDTFKNNLSSGDYSVTITDSLGCKSDTSINILYFQEPTLTLNAIDDICEQNDGSIVASLFFGTPNFTYNWNTGANSPSLNNLSTGWYKLTVTDAMGCIAKDSAFISTTLKPRTNLFKYDASCNLPNGGVYGKTILGVSPFIYNWNNTYNTDSLYGMDSGMYVLTVIDSNSCVFVDSIYLPRIASVSGALTSVSEKCTKSNGSLISNILSGTGPFKYEWNTGDTLPNLTNIGAGLYGLSITDALNCKYYIVESVTDSSGPVVLHTNILAQCGLSNGSILSNVVGMNEPFSYFWNNVPSSKDITGINGGTFIFKVIDSKGCIYKDTIERIPIAPLSNSFVFTNANCDLLNGKIISKPAGGQSPYSFSWSNGASKDSIENLAPNKYILTLADTSGCVLNDSVTITQSGTPIVSLQIQNGTCSDANGKVKAIIQGGQLPYTFLWSNGATIDSIKNLVANAYSLTVTDHNGCAVSSIANVTTTGMTGLTLLKKDPVCNGNNGLLWVTPIGGQAPYSYTWNTGSTNDSLYNLAPGKYIVSVTDANNCTLIDSVTIQAQSTPKIQFNAVGIAFCGKNNGYVLSKISGGKAPYSYNWSNGSTMDFILNLDSGKYALTVIDSDGCKDSLSTNVNRLADLKVDSIVKKSFCGYSNGMIKAIVSGGTSPYFYSWSTGVTIDSIKNLNTGIYTLAVKDANQCQKNLSFKIDDIPRPILAPIKEDAVCGKDNGVIDAQIEPNTGTSPFSYIWSNGQTTAKISNLATGIYHIKVTDANGCIDTMHIGINFAINPSLTLNHKNVICSDSNGFVTTSLVRAVEPVIYKWNNGATSKDLINLKAGKYIVTVADAKSCEMIDSVIITDEPGPKISITSVQSYCLKSNGSINVSISNGTSPLSFIWNNGSNTQSITNIPQGNYRLTVTDINKCMDTASVSIIDEPNTLSLKLSKKDLICNMDPKGEINCDAQGGEKPYLYRTQFGTFSPNPLIGGLLAGEYTVTVEDNKGCQANGKITLNEPNKVVTNTIFKKNLLCYEEPTGIIQVATMGGVSPYTYSWITSSSDSDKSVNLKAGIHNVKIKDFNGCESIYSDTLTQPDNLTIMDSLFHPKCFGQENGKIVLEVSGGTPTYKFKWNNNKLSQNIYSLKAGSYKLTVEDGNSCIDSFNFQLVDPPLIKFSKIEAIDKSCDQMFDGEIKLQGWGGQGEPYQYSINGGKSYSYTKNYKNLDSGKYYVFVKDANDCIIGDSTKVGVLEDIKINAFPKDTTINLGQSVSIDFDVIKGQLNKINSILWEPDFGLECNSCKKTKASPYQTTTYDVTVSYNNSNCKVSDKVIVRINDNSELFVPNAFTPNNDKDNDILKVYGVNVKFAKMKIFNRWGEKVFESSNAIIEGWDGYYNGELSPNGVYTYSLETHFLNKKIKTSKGSITLIR